MIRKIQVGEDWLTVSVVKPSSLAQSRLTVYYKGYLRLLVKFLSLEQSKIVK